MDKSGDKDHGRKVKEGKPKGSDSEDSSSKSENGIPCPDEDPSLDHEGATEKLASNDKYNVQGAGLAGVTRPVQQANQREFHARICYSQGRCQR